MKSLDFYQFVTFSKKCDELLGGKLGMKSIGFLQICHVLQKVCCIS